jgi:hypothetical protein
MGKRLIFLLALLFMSITVTQAGAQQATVQVVPASYTVLNVGLTFNVNITVQNVENLYGYEFKLYYPNDILNGTSVTQGPFLKGGGIQIFFSVAQFTDNYNATHGLLNVICTRSGNVSGVNGGGTLVAITFKSTSTNGPRTLQLADVALSDPNPAAIPFTSADGEVTVIPEFPTALILPLLIISASVTLTLRKRKKKLEKSSIPLL